MSVLNGDAHAAAGAGDLGHSGLDGGGGQVGHLLLGDLLDLCFGDGSDLVLVETPPVRFPSALRRHLLDTPGDRRRSKHISAYL